ncbi:hypothetical protein Tco_1237496 [Tanacetum coccineum]
MWKRSKEEVFFKRCGRNQMGNEPILALPEGADDFVVYYDARSKDLEACLEKGRRLSNRWLSMKKDVASCDSKYLAYSRVEIEYQGSSGLLLQPELPKTSRVDLRVLMPQVVKSRDEIFSRWRYCDNQDLSRSFVKLFVKLFVGIFWKAKQSYCDNVSFMRILGLREVARTTARIALEFAPEFVYVCCMDFVECYLILLGDEWQWRWSVVAAAAAAVGGGAEVRDEEMLVVMLLLMVWRRGVRVARWR